MKSKYQFLIGRWPILSALLVILIAIIGYHVRDYPTSKFYVLQDEQGQTTLLVNGKDVTNYERHVPGWEVYAKYFNIYGEQTSNKVAIQQHGTTVYEKYLEPGSYVVNLSQNYNVSFHEVAYARPVDTPGLLLPPSPMGVYFIDKSLHILAFDFHKEPPHSMTSRHGSAKNTRYLNLIAERSHR